MVEEAVRIDIPVIDLTGLDADQAEQNARGLIVF